MTQRERLTAGGKMKLRKSVFHKEARRKKRVTMEKQRKAVPVQYECWWKESGGRLPRHCEAEQETDVCVYLCRLQQVRWEIHIIHDYLTRNILKIVYGILELWNRKVSHFLTTRTEETSTALFTITVDSSHSAHSYVHLVFPDQTTLSPNHSHTGPKEPASPSDEGCLLVTKKESSFQHSRISHSDRTPSEKGVFGPSLLLRVFAFLPSSPSSGNYLGVWGGLCILGRAVGRRGADPDLKRNDAIWEKSGSGEK